ncbi:DUF2510 domain-containing protein [Microbacterium ulmi]|uniref:DUF2510 domain-containing protein n=1 Tax=Microbacterium ulmi TaxID=179095 RepID=A0A7Y2LXU4_9MICO|nr:DUF2510 domain-containing protein [Microbacterium ulmi]NII70794.1 hypothetical protein [Microbacterium ulmi]NNH02811.1 hypothetical protein [Microbacterium ulmi]
MNSIPAGWYPDGAEWETFWDGRGWTDRHRMRPPAVAPADDGRPDFRSARWGDSVDDVQEDAALLHGDDRLMLYASTIDSRRVTIGYEYVEGLLVAGRYVVADRYPSPQHYVDAFGSFTTLLSKDHGDPVVDRPVWEPAARRVPRDQWGAAVRRGDLRLMAAWTSPRTEIVLLLEDVGHESRLGVVCSSRTHADWIEAVRRNQALALL